MKIIWVHVVQWLPQLLQSSNNNTSSGQVWKKLPEHALLIILSHYQGRLITFNGGDKVEQPGEHDTWGTQIQSDVIGDTWITRDCWNVHAWQPLGVPPPVVKSKCTSTNLQEYSYTTYPVYIAFFPDSQQHQQTKMGFHSTFPFELFNCGTIYKRQ